MIEDKNMSLGLLNIIPTPFDKKPGWPYTDEIDPYVYSSDINWPKISVITPSYNQGNFIEATIRSVLLQNYPNIEYIIMDGGSEDQTVDIIEAYASRINYWESQKDEGQSSAINEGFKRATGDIYCWLNSDDVFLPHALYKVATQFRQINCDWLAGECIFTDIDLKPRWQYRIIEENPLKYLEFWNSIFLAQPSVFFSANLWNKYGGCRTDLYYSMDLDLWLRFFEHSIPFFLRENLSINRVHETAKTYSGGYRGLKEISTVIYQSTMNQTGFKKSLVYIEKKMKRYHYNILYGNFFHDFHLLLNKLTLSKLPLIVFLKILLRVNYSFLKKLLPKKQ